MLWGLLTLIHLEHPEGFLGLGFLFCSGVLKVLPIPSPWCCHPVNPDLGLAQLSGELQRHFGGSEGIRVNPKIGAAPQGLLLLLLLALTGLTPSRGTTVIQTVKKKSRIFFFFFLKSLLAQVGVSSTYLSSRGVGQSCPKIYPALGCPRVSP